MTVGKEEEDSRGSRQRERLCSHVRLRVGDKNVRDKYVQVWDETSWKAGRQHLAGEGKQKIRRRRESPGYPRLMKPLISTYD